VLDLGWKLLKKRASAARHRSNRLNAAPCKTLDTHPALQEINMHHAPFGPADGPIHCPATLTASPYVVSLQDCPGISLKDRMAAEVRYRKALERRLGSP
jgi:hypothetical protein